MTFHILIVGDEPIIRRGLCDTIPWEQNQIHVVGAACDGKEAIQKIKNDPQIDLVITDIRMPNYEELFYKTPGAVDLFHTEGINVTFYNTLTVLKGLFEKDTKKRIEHLRNKKGQNKDWRMGRAEEYIKTYSASDIKAHEVADFINISPNYFSSLFKKATGQTFNEYVNTLRIEEAKTLVAKTSFKVNELAGQVGYKEYKCFVKVFKKVCGITPTI